jgi:hypothetical protein
VARADVRGAGAESGYADGAYHAVIYGLLSAGKIRRSFGSHRRYKLGIASNDTDPRKYNRSKRSNQAHNLLDMHKLCQHQDDQSKAGNDWPVVGFDFEFPKSYDYC